MLVEYQRQHEMARLRSQLKVESLNRQESGLFTLSDGLSV